MALGMRSRSGGGQSRQSGDPTACAIAAYSAQSSSHQR